MNLTAAEHAYVRAQGLCFTEKCDGCGTLLNQAVRFTINSKPQPIRETFRSRLNQLVFTSPEALRGPWRSSSNSTIIGTATKGLAM